MRVWCVGRGGELGDVGWGGGRGQRKEWCSSRAPGEVILRLCVPLLRCEAI